MKSFIFSVNDIVFTLETSAARPATAASLNRNSIKQIGFFSTHLLFWEQDE